MQILSCEYNYVYICIPISHIMKAPTGYNYVKNLDDAILRECIASEQARRSPISHEISIFSRKLIDIQLTTLQAASHSCYHVHYP